MTYQEYTTLQSSLLNKAQQLYCSTVEEVVGIKLRKSGISFLISPIDDPDIVRTVYLSKNDAQFSRAFANIFEVL